MTLWYIKSQDIVVQYLHFILSILAVFVWECDAVTQKPTTHQVLAPPTTNLTTLIQMVTVITFVQ